MNIIGVVACADMDKSDYKSLGEGMNVIDELVLDDSKLYGLDLFLVAEDTDCIVVSERVHDYLNSRSNDDIYFEELKIV